MGEGNIFKKALVNAMRPFFFQTGAMRTEVGRPIKSGVNRGIGKNIRKSLKNGFGTAVFFEIVVNESDF